VQSARIVAAASAAAVDRGVGALTVGEVIARAGVSRRTFYEVFEGLDECLRAALEAALAAAAAPVAAAYAADGADAARAADTAHAARARAPWRVRVRAALAALLLFCEREPVYAHLLLVDSLAAGPAALARRREVLAQLAHALDPTRGEPAGRSPSSSSSSSSRLPGAAARARATGLSPLLAEGVVGGVLAILHERVRAGERSLLELCPQLMAMIVLPYLGAAAARRELERPAPQRPAGMALARGDAGAGGARGAAPGSPLDGLPMRLTYRTVSVLRAIAAAPASSNRAIGHAAGVSDQGQISKLLSRLRRLGLVSNDVAPRARGEANSWTLTARGAELVAVTGMATAAGPAGAEGGGG
jgi:AcrR family transcriptional regulator